MSLYGNVKKVGSSTFQFDRVYGNRKAMDDAANTDGVYIGRYVLVEYGERFNGTTGLTGDNVTYTLVNDEQGAARIQGVNENEDFRDNAEIDLRAYGAAYDSTVWQKIYADGVDKYVMVAELNATTPRIEFIQEKPYLYKHVNDNEPSTDGIYTGNFDTQGHLDSVTEVKNAVEEFNKPHFDLGLDTELSYLLHLPTPVNLEVSNDNIDIHKKGFNPAYSYGEKNKPSTIAWLPEGLTVDAQGKLIADTEVDTQKLYMNLTAFGDVMNTLYNLLYGKPADNSNFEEGALRPYFQQYRDLIADANRDRTNVQVYVRDKDNNLVKLQYILFKGQPDTEETINVTVDGTIGESVIVHAPDAIATLSDTIPFNFDPEYDVIPVNNDGESFIQVCYYDNTSSSYKPFNKDDHMNYGANNHFFYDTRVIPITPLEFVIPDVTGDTDNQEWMQDIPELSEILKNNTSGLASVLANLFGYRDPFTGEIRYYLFNDWETKVEKDSNGPAITNKPKVVCSNDQAVGDYYVDFSTWELVEKTPSSLEYNPSQGGL